MQITVADYESSQINWTLAVISFTLLVYEYILTFHYEVERFWPTWLRKPFESSFYKYTSDSKADHGRGHDTSDNGMCGFTWVSLFFFLNRYLGLLGHIPVMVEYFWRFDEQGLREHLCGCLRKYHQFLVLVIQSVIACTMVMRTYALYGRRKWIAILYSAIAFVVIGLGTWAIIISDKSEDHAVVPIPYGCGVTLAAEKARYLAAAWSGELVFDALIFGMTLYKSLTLSRGSGIKLLTMLVRDGTIYFGAMVVVNIGNIISFLLGGPLSRGSVTMFTNVLSSVMISRLMFNLRDPKLHKNGSEAGSDYDASTTNGGGSHEGYGVMTTVGGDLSMMLSNSWGTRWDPEV